jgi:hypothetical protein
MRRLIHKPVALAGRQRRSSVPAGLRLPQPRPIGAFVNKPYHFSNSYLISLLLNLTHTTPEYSFCQGELHPRDEVEQLQWRLARG